MDFNHTMDRRAIQSLHPGQLIMHGPVWYTDDVHGFLSSRIDSDPLYHFYPLFAKDREYRDQLEYRFALHCESPTQNETLLLNVTGDMLAALAPHRPRSPVSFRPVRAGDEAPASPQVARSVDTITSTRTRRDRTDSRWTVTDRQQGTVVQEGTHVDEHEVVVTTEASGLGLRPDADLQTLPEALVRITRRSERTRTVDGIPVDTATLSRTLVATVDERASFDHLFEPDDAEQPAELLEAARKPFAAIAEWPPAVAGLLEGLAAGTVGGDPETEVQAMCACWNAIWAVANICTEFGDIVESVGIEDGKFVAIAMRQSPAGVQGKILVGPRGTFAYLLSPIRLSHHGGTTGRLILFPDDVTRSHFEQAGWSPLTTARTEQPAD